MGFSMTELTVHVTRAEQVNDPYFYVHFDMSEGTTRLHVTTDYEKAEDCIIDLGIVRRRHCADARSRREPSRAAAAAGAHPARAQGRAGFELAQQPIRALSNPIYTEGIRD